MAVFLKKDSESVSTGWQTCHVVLYTMTGALGFAASLAYYSVVVRSHYRCYQYNEVQMVYEEPGGVYKLHWPDRRVWYRNENCYDPFAFTLALSVLSAVWTVMCLVFGRGGLESSDHESNRKFFSGISDQWRIVFWACLFNIACYMWSLIIAIQFSNGYQKFLSTVLRLPEGNDFRKEFEYVVQPYYNVSVVLFWCINVVCMLNCILTICRCALGVDFEIVYDVDEGDLLAVIDLESVHSSNREDSSKED